MIPTDSRGKDGIAAAGGKGDERRETRRWEERALIEVTGRREIGVSHGQTLTTPLLLSKSCLIGI